MITENEVCANLAKFLTKAARASIEGRETADERWSLVADQITVLIRVTVTNLMQPVIRPSTAAQKVGCKNFEMRDGRMFCRNCGFHYDEH